MRISKKLPKIILSLVLAAMLAGTVFSCTPDVPNSPAENTPSVTVPSETPTTPPITAPDKKDETGTTPEKLTAAEFLQKVHAASKDGFTVTARPDATMDPVKYVTSEGKSELSYGETRIVYGDGLTYTPPNASDLLPNKDSSRRDTAPENAPEKPLYTAVESDGIFAFDSSEADFFSELKTAIEQAEDVPNAELNGEKYELSYSRSFAEILNRIFGICKTNIDKPTHKALTELVGVITNRELTKEQALAFLAEWMEMPLEQLVFGDFKPAAAIRDCYDKIKSVAGKDESTPDYGAMLSQYLGLSLNEILGIDGAEAANAFLDKPLKDNLKACPYGAGTLDELFLSTAQTTFEECYIAVAVSATKEFIPVSATVTASLKIKNLPVPEPSLNDSGKRETIKDVIRGGSLKLEFSDVGKSKVTLPERYVIVGEQKLSVTGAGIYDYKCGTDNTLRSEISVMISEQSAGNASGADRPEWLSDIRKVGDGIIVYAEKKQIAVNGDAAAGLKSLKARGYKKVVLSVFNEFDFIIEL